MNGAGSVYCSMSASSSGLSYGMMGKQYAGNHRADHRQHAETQTHRREHRTQELLADMQLITHDDQNQRGGRRGDKAQQGGHDLPRRRAVDGLGVRPARRG